MLDYSSMWDNWNLNLGPNDWDFVSIRLLLTPYQDWSAFPTPLYMISGTLPRFTQLSWWSPAIDPHFTPNWQGCMIAKPDEIFPNLQEEPSIHPQNEVNALLHPYWRNAWLQNPDKIFPNLQKEFCIHPPDKVNPPIVPTLEECLAYVIAPPTNRVHHPPNYPWHPILDHTSIRHPLQWDTTIPSPLPYNPWYPIFGLHEYASPTLMRYHIPSHYFIDQPWTYQTLMAAR